MQLHDEIEAQLRVEMEHHLVEDRHVAPVVQIPQLLQILVVLNHQGVADRPAKSTGILSDSLVLPFRRNGAVIDAL